MAVNIANENLLKKTSEKLKNKDTMDVTMSDGSISDEYVLVKKRDADFEKEYNKLVRSIIYEIGEMYDTFRCLLRFIGIASIIGGVFTIGVYPKINEPILSFNVVMIGTVLSALVTLIIFLLPSAQLIKDLLALKMKHTEYYSD